MGREGWNRCMKRDLEPIAPGISSMLRRLGLSNVDTFFTIVAAWPGATDEPWKSGAEPAMLEGGELTVRATNRAAIRVLSFGVPDLIERLNEALGAPIIESVRLVPPGPSGPPE